MTLQHDPMTRRNLRRPLAHLSFCCSVLLPLVLGCEPGTVSTLVNRSDAGARRPDGAPPLNDGISINLPPNGTEPGDKLDSGEPSPGVDVDAEPCTACEDAPQVAICGDGILQLAETCDDGNSTPGDGCSGICLVEPGYVCPTPGSPCVLIVTRVCGDGIIQAGEACDDGNANPDDGCSAICDVEQGWVCPVPGQACKPTAKPPVCGNGVPEAGEQCDDNNTLGGDGCTSLCKLEPRWNCPLPGKPCVPVEYCGDGFVQPTLGEDCDDGNATPGDGCSGICTVEQGHQCPIAGQPCIKIWVCGNGMIDQGEACDDGNSISGDGCIADCTSVELGWSCPKGANNTGGPCKLLPTNLCGNGSINPGEGCDDGNMASTDGCSSTCLLEPGWSCLTPGRPCVLISICGDGALNLDRGEQCDDGNAVSGDGCTLQCRLEPDFVCPVPGQPCISTVKCGDGKISGSEQCDDKNVRSGDGCSATCRLEAGWACPVVGAACTSKACGDGILAGDEQCDDGDAFSGDGCSATCRLEPGFACGRNTWHPAALSTQCYATVCGDGHKEGTEQCDDGNTRPFDGCSPTCTNEPHCGYRNNDPGLPYKCFSVCGDGIKMPDEACDDGNLQNGDGCSSLCAIETGFSCTASAPALGSSITVPILYRDFNWHHPQFEVNPSVDASYGNRLAGIANSAIGTSGKPVYNPAFVGYNNGVSLGRPWTMDGPAMDAGTGLMSDAAGATFRTKLASNAATLDAAQIAASYAQWYTDDANATGDPVADAANPDVMRITLQSTLTLNQITAGTYQYYNSAFFPLDGLGFGNISVNNHNYHFTSETHYWFQYGGGEQFEFRGDDDVWVFVNGILAVDLGGIHGELRGIAKLNGANSQVCVDDKPPGCAGAQVCDNPPPSNCTTIANSFGMTVGNIYEIILFQAERHVTGSNYKLTLRGFNAPRSVCTSVCGDGIVTRGEACDLGTAHNTGEYGTCNPDCSLPARCGDSVVQNPPEECDDGVNLATYGGAVRACAPSCKFAPYCGDSVISNGEECDEGITNGAGYGHCTSACKVGQRCGDGVKNGPEQCDEGAANGTSGSACMSTCMFKCGNGEVDPGEQCDNGIAKNIGGYAKCNPNCTLGPRCGDGIKNGNEQCDDGKNDGTYGTCAPACLLPPYCGDGAVNGPETCDLGAQNSAQAYGAGLCTNQCKPSPYCGNKQVDFPFGEVCDDGVNSGLPGSCTPDCKGFVPLPSCGDGIVLAPEQCDDGGSNGTAQSRCDVHCRVKCGNGVKEAGEQCDDGVNNGSYGTCNPDCTLAAYCGDGRKNGLEQCDFGVANVSLSISYGLGMCTTACGWAPYCGDGRIQTPFGEVCDGGNLCSATCDSLITPIYIIPIL